MTISRRDAKRGSKQWFCTGCGKQMFLVANAPHPYWENDLHQGWVTMATDRDFVCYARTPTSNFPQGAPHSGEWVMPGR